MLPKKKWILEEYRRLDKLCGVDTRYMDCCTYHADENTVAYCKYVTHTAIPARIFFNRLFLDTMPDADCVDVVRHEYAHAAAALLYGPEALDESGHGPLWRRICDVVGCRPSPYTYNLNVPEPLIQNIQGSNSECCRVECCRCGSSVEQPKDSRIVQVLRAGLTSWNFTCPVCGGLRFRLVDA